jgi:hypothetical protein
VTGVQTCALPIYLAALAGNEEAQSCRADVAEEMTGRQIAEAQRQARAWIASTSLRAA